MSEKVNVGIAGYGAIAKTHIEALQQIDKINIVAVCDIIKERADEGAKACDAIAYYDYDEMMKNEDIAFVHICTPHYLHFPMTAKALDAGKRVVVEKPITMTKEELEILFSKYDTKKVFPIIQNRTNDCAKKLFELIANEDYGKLLGAKGIVTWRRSEAYYNSAEWRGTKAYEGGGVLINQAVHTLDILVLVAGRAKSVTATTANHSLKGVIEVEDTVDAYIKFENGAIGLFYATNGYGAHPPFQLEFAFEKANFIYYYGKLYKDGELVCEDSEDFLGKSYWGNGHTKTFYDLYVDNSKLCADDVKNTMDVMFGIYESAEKNCEINL